MATTHFSLNSLKKMNSALNKELEQLGQYTSISTLRQGKENFPTRDTLSSHSLAPSDFTKSTISYNGGISGRSSNYTRQPVKAFDSHPMGAENDSTKNRMMQKELFQLHSRVLDLEKQVNCMETTNTKDILRKSYLSTANNSLCYNSAYESNRVSQTLGNQSAKKTGPKESLSRSALRSTTNEFRRDSGVLRESSLVYQDHKMSSNEEYERKSKAKETPYASRKRYGQSAVKVEMRKELADTDDSSASEKGNYSGYVSGRSGKSASKGKKRTQSVNYVSCDEEIADLNKRIVNMKKEYHEDRAALIKERILGKEIGEKIRKTALKMRRMEAKLDSVAKTEADYERLVDSFNKSEQIRNQQRYLIGNLNYEVTLLKAEKEKFVEKEEKSMSVIVNRSMSSSHKKKSNKKVKKLW